MANISTVVKELFTHVPERSTPEEMVFICPQCGDQGGNRSVNLRTGKTNCWRCGRKPGTSGDFVRWCRRLGFKVDDLDSMAVSATDAEKLLNQVENEKFSPLVTDVRLPVGFTKIKDDPESGYARLIERMAIRKNLTLNDMAKVDVGFTTQSALWEPYAIFPVYEYGQLVYYQGRTYTSDPDVAKTKRFPSRNECPYGASYWVYNIDAIRHRRPRLIVVVEAMLNVLSLEKVCDDFVAVCVFKHAISPIQLQKITSFDSVEEICVLYDSDSTENAWAEVGSRVINKVQASIAKMPLPEGRKKADPNDDAVLAIESLNRRQTYSTAGELGMLLEKL